MMTDQSKKFADWVLVLISLISIAGITYYISLKRAEEDLIRFEYEASLITRKIQTRMDSYEAALIETRAFLRNAHSTKRDQLRSYIKETEIFERLPGLQGLGYTVMVRKDELKEHINEMRKDIPNYSIWPKGDRDIYSSIIVLEPSDWRNIRAIGYDMYEEPKRRKAMNEARDLNKAIMTEKVVLVQEEEEKPLPGFLVYLPHYKKNADISTVERRREALIGFTYSPFRIKELFSAIFSDIDMILDVKIYGNGGADKNLFYHYSNQNYESNFKSEKTIHLNGRTWILKFSQLPHFPKATSLKKDLLVFITGCIIGLAIFSIYFFTKKQMELANTVAEEKEKLLKKEKEHVAARDEFLSIASHELKTPLTSLKLQAQVMMRAIKRNDPSVFSPEKVTSLVKQIDNQTTRLTRLVDDMLDISRIRTGKLKMEKHTVELNEVVLDVVERLTPQFIEAIGTPPEIELTQGIVGFWDKFRIEQVITNLLTNAIRYGNGKPVQVKTALIENDARIIVKDMGVGIAEENIKKIFERFERAGVSANNVSGLGLGLFITKQIVHSHGGEIEVKSEIGKGSTFIVHLPLNQGHETYV